MDNMEGRQLFRQKSLERLKTPDTMDDYIKVTKPALWLVLAAVIVLLVGVCVWGAFGVIETRVEVPFSVHGGTVMAIIPTRYIDYIKPGMTIDCGDGETVITEITDAIGTGNELMNPRGTRTDVIEYLYNTDFGGFKRIMDDTYFVANGTTTLPDGSYNGSLVVEQVRPISFLFN